MQEEGKDEDWNKYSAPVTSGKKVGPFSYVAPFGPNFPRIHFGSWRLP